MVVEYTVNAGRLEAGSWYGDAELQGSRFVGEGGHFVDTISWWLGADPVEVSATVVGDDPDNLVCRLVYPDGSLGIISYLTEGDAAYPKETLTVVGEGRVARMSNFRRAGIYRGGRKRRVGSGIRGGVDKGQRRQLDSFIEAVRQRWADAHSVRIASPHVRGDVCDRPGGGIGTGRCPRRAGRDLRRHGPGLVPASLATDDPGRGGGACRRPLSPDDAADRCPEPPAAGGAHHALSLSDQTAAWSRGPRRASQPPTVCSRAAWAALGVVRDDMVPVPDWFLDPVSGIRAPHDMFSFDIEHRDPGRVGSIKQIWELSRHHHLTVLAAAFAITGRAAYAEMAAAHLRDWWQRNPLGRGPHWISGIELGIRMTSWVWTRRLLAGWGGVEDLFDLNPDFHRQLAWHQWYLARFPSRGSSANNHLLAEAAGQLIAATAFPWFRQSAGWAAAGT